MSIDSSSGGLPADFAFINSVDELHAGNDNRPLAGTLEVCASAFVHSMAS